MFLKAGELIDEKTGNPNAVSSVPVQNDRNFVRFDLSSPLLPKPDQLRQGLLPGAFQSAWSSDGRVYILLQGEVYNEEINQENPCGSIADAFCAEGHNLLSKLNGSFIIILLDTDAQRLMLVCDRTASKALYFALGRDSLTFSSTLKPMLSGISSAMKVDPYSAASFLAGGFLLEGRTLASGIRTLGPGEMLVVENGQVQHQTYWQYGFTQPRDTRSPADLEQELFHLILQAVARRTQGQEALGLMLSGGYDSRIILGCVKKLYPDHRLQTVTWGVNQLCAQCDATLAAQLGAMVGSKHTFFPLHPQALPRYFADFVNLNEGRTDAVGNYPESLRFFQESRDSLGLTYLLRGDECYGGSGLVDTEIQGLHRLQIHSLPGLAGAYPFIKKEVRAKLDQASAAQISRIIQKCPWDNLHDRKDYFCYTEHLFGYLNPLSQLKERHIQIRNPHLDNDVLDFISRIPTPLRLGKALLRSTTRNLLPELCRPGFALNSSLINWDQQLRMEADLQQYVREVLLENPNGFSNLLDHNSLRNFLAESFIKSPPRLWPLGHSRKKWRRLMGRYELSRSQQIFRLMILKIWADQFNMRQFDFSV
jgi:asparagine synthetase B (glutamine-hydrolysing)